MVPKGLVHPQGHPWSLAGSEVVDWLGSRIFPSRTAGLYRVLDLGWLLAAGSSEEVGVKIRGLLLLGVQLLDR